MPSYDHRRPLVSVDVALFSLIDAPTRAGASKSTEKRLAAALAPRRAEPFAGVEAIPGAYVRLDEDVDLAATAERALRDKCGLDPSAGVYLEQLATYGGADRDPRDWSVTVAYWALIAPGGLPSAADGGALRLVEAAKAKRLPFDHDQIIAEGVARLRSKAGYTTAPALLLPPSFTLRDLEEAYEACLGRKVFTAGFRRRMESLTFRRGGRDTPWLRPTGESRRDGGRPAMLYEKTTDEVVVFPQMF